MERFTFFWQNASPFSQWHKSVFVVADNTFTSAEQWMMYQKAMLFNDQETADAILRTTNPKTQKALGRKVKNFDETVWIAHRERIVYEGNYHKFSQNPDLKEALLATEGTTLVEASPLDKIWGIGLAEHHEDAKNRHKWRGLNLLGVALTQLRDDLLQES